MNISRTVQASLSAAQLRWLLELTSLPTASGCEQLVVAWVKKWATARKLETSEDEFGNLTLQRPGPRTLRPLYFTAHMDHPALVAVEAQGKSNALAELRGHVKAQYLPGTRVMLHPGSRHSTAVRGRVVELNEYDPSQAAAWGAGDDPKWVKVELDKPARVSRGDILTWDVGPARVVDGRLEAPACDNLAGVAAALTAMDQLGHGEQGKTQDVRVLLTRAEEVGFVGAIAACKSGTIPRQSRLVVLENSKAFTDSPLGHGPVVRVGDFTSTFDPEITYRLGQLAGELKQENPAFVFQRKLMTGGTCEASAFQVYGYQATCLCLPLGRYHNMNEQSDKLEAETINLADFAGMVRLLTHCGKHWDDKAASVSLRTRLDELFLMRHELLGKVGGEKSEAADRLARGRMKPKAH